MPKILVAGGGIAGLISAALLAKKFPAAQITLLEAGKELGGLLRSFDYGKDGKFDYGTHYLMESGIAEIDEIYEAALPSDKRRFMKGYATDLSGIYCYGTLQVNTPFIDLRNNPKWATYLASFMRHVAEMPELGAISDYANAFEYFAARYGSEITTEVIAPVIQKIFHQDLPDMFPMGAMLTPLQRIALLDQRLMDDLLETQLLPPVIAYPEQRELPKDKQPTLRASYPKERGIGAVIDGLQKHLEALGVDVRLGTLISQLKAENGQIGSVNLKASGSDVEESMDVDLVVWAGGMPPLAKLMSVWPEGRPDTDPPLTTVLTHMIVDRPLNMSDIYYFYCYEKGFDTFRVTNYRNLSADSDAIGENPLTVEMIFTDNCPSIEELNEKAQDELRRMAVLPDEAQVTFCRSEVLNYGFPLMTSKNARFFATLRQGIREQGLQNLVICGALSEPNVFFQKDVLTDLHAKLSDLNL